MTWEDPTQPASARAEALVTAARGRKDLKRLGAWLEDHGDEALREALIARAARLGVELPEEAATWPGKRLLRRAMAREVEAQVRTTPVKRDEAFTCRWCGREVPKAGRTDRDHCPFCLKSVHVDERVPGDRASTCEGRLDPHDVTVSGTEIVLTYRCTRCGVIKRNRAILDGEVPDDWDALVRLSSGVLG